MQVRITYCVTRDRDEEDASIADVCLSSEERARRAEFTFPCDRRDFAAAHVLLRHALSDVQPRDPATWMFARSASGKPRLADADPSRGRLTFNLSHTRGLVACIVATGGDVGIDVERVLETGDLFDVAQRHFSPSECLEIESCDPAARAARFADFWTLKEAHAKAVGIGIAGGLNAATFAFTDNRSLHVVSGCAADSDWTFAVFAILHYRLAIAVHNTIGDALTLHITESGTTTSGQSGARLLGMSAPSPVVLSGAM